MMVSTCISVPLGSAIAFSFLLLLLLKLRILLLYRAVLALFTIIIIIIEIVQTHSSIATVMDRLHINFGLAGFTLVFGIVYVAAVYVIAVVGCARVDGDPCPI